jgi:epoxide hydrolase 4
MHIQTGNYIEASPGVRLHYATCGAQANPTVILVHGFPEYWGAWAEVMPLLAAQGWFVVAPDIRGFNLSDKPTALKEYANKAVSQDLAHLLQHFSKPNAIGAVQKPLLVAHDWGGAAAWTLGIHAPESMLGLVIVNSPHPYMFWRELSQSAEQQQASAYMNWLCQPQSEVLLAKDDFQRMQGFFTKLSDAPWFKGETRERYLAAWAQPGALTGGVNYYRASPLVPPTETHPGAKGLTLQAKDFVVRAPTLLLWGMKDVALPAGLIDGIEQVVERLTLIRLPECSHWVSHEIPERLANEIARFGAERIAGK